MGTLYHRSVAWRAFVAVGGKVALLLLSLLFVAPKYGRSGRAVIGRCGVIPLPGRVVPRRKQFRVDGGMEIVAATYAPSMRVVTSDLVGQLGLASKVAVGRAFRGMASRPIVHFIPRSKVPRRKCGLSIAPRGVALATSAPGKFFCTIRALCRLLPPIMCNGRGIGGTR